MSKTEKNKKLTNQTQMKVPAIVKWIWGLMILGILVLGVIFVYISKTQLPDTKELEQPNFEIATKILADDGRELGRAFKLNREWISFEELNPVIVDALVSTEDERYYSHSGIDFRGTIRAIVFMGSKGGASTITQQLAKLFFTQRANSFLPRLWQKFKEWVIAVEFEKRYTKEEIIAMYLNKYDYLYGAIGIGSAARTYFGKNQKDLTVEEAAVLIGLLKNPWIYNPKKFPENARKRRDVVLKQMLKNDKLSRKKYANLIKSPIDISKFQREENYSGPAPYFRAELIKEVKTILNQKKYRKRDGSLYNPYTDGLTIETTIDYDMQRHAEEALKVHMKALQKKFEKEWKGLDPWTYKADKKQRKIRMASLARQVRESERFRNLRLRYIGDISNEIITNIEGARLWDTDIFRLFNEEKKPGTLAKYIKSKTISRNQAKVYRKILDSEYWPKLKKQWMALQRKKEKVFATPVKMKIFAYNDQGEAMVTMTPLDSIKYHNKLLQLGSISVDPHTGMIKTWVGGIGHKYFKFDHIRSNRQVGSTFKPFVYGTAIDELGISPCQKVKDQQYVIPAGDPKFGLTKSWAPANARGTFSNAYVTLKEGLRKSLNSVSLYLMKEIGNVERVRDFANQMGIPKEKIPPSPSICLGVAELSVMDMAGAYTTFANNGVHVRPFFIKAIKDINGRVIYTGTQKKNRAISESVNYAMVDLLKHVTQTNIAARLGIEMGGKTGTTDDYKDGWFMGVTPDLIVATWVGGDNEWIRFRSLANGQGAKMARPFCEEFLKRLIADKNSGFDPNATFHIPENMDIELDCSIYEKMEAEDMIKKQMKENEKKAQNNEFDEEEEMEEDFEDLFDEDM